MGKKEPSAGSLEDFIAKNTQPTTDREEVETLILERDELHTVTILDHHTFDGKFGPSVVVKYDNGKGVFKTYLGGFEVTHFNAFIEGKTLPLQVNLARVKQESASNEGRSYNRLVINTV